MAVNKVVYNNRVLIDLTQDTVVPNTLKKGVTAHDKSGKSIIGTFEGDDSDKIDRMLTAGLVDGYKNYSDDGKIITEKDSNGVTLKKTFSDNFSTCTTVLLDKNGRELGRTVKTFSNDGRTIVTTDSKGYRLTKTFSSDLSRMDAEVKDKSNRTVKSLIKRFTNDGMSIVTTTIQDNTRN